MSSTRPERIDVHHHLCPPDYADEVNRIKPVFKALLDWSPQSSLEDMDRGHVATAIVSMTTPGLWFGDDAAARRLCRACNEYAARLAADHPGRFGFFAALSLPDVDGSLREAEYALDVLKADGVALFTSYGDKYLGHAQFHPLMAELDRRKAVAYTHPTVSDCWVNLVPETSEATIEYGTDTTRTIASLVFSGTAARYRGIRFIFSHAGGTMPFLVERLQLLPSISPKIKQGGWDFDEVTAQLTRYHYDTAQAAHPGALSSLMRLVSVSQVVFGTDYPFRTSIDHVKGLAAYFSGADLRAIERDNAARLMPRLQG
jgi:predicted TIM-barrel fold metal-dependent hydrolase